ncbi:phosphoribosylamine--glycine ligase [Cocleimonas sp. KMM 6892]|uniref:phosphoribosylamine--glycine ligase n=1 Tax=unclassified Cocleimonas TaxID=2639732 RepID=UPI002DBACE16|nr:MULTISPECIES: phosphoribosylamine--glycine ligase [unclassified Cocleimonas]MEB8430979.1 phosphoribosylamine--glycine ligase [Cocleimonas sp. KMM 6892]MEC4714249.1 phosphoribosylamine--glycine ligase [Cocleimonas sp. KMM 6895]MEC4743580.1 phosphoribosylamine--glycine ligase [Cocleimonas sp. KMM 6896]
MKVLLIGSGGREHALAWKIAQSERVEKVIVAPGNAGTALEEKVENVDIGAEDIEGLLAFAQENNVDLTVVGPEAPLVKGVVDLFAENGLRCFGPSKGAAQLEGSKAFSKDFFARHNIPTAAYGNFTDIDEAIAYIKEQGAPIVVKADGLAAGKGVILAETEDEAIAAVKDMLAGNAFGDAGHRVVIEEFLVGEEASIIVIADGKNYLPMASSQDHKARDEGDLGPNTGGMGAYSPAPVVTDEISQKIMKDVIEPTLKGMADEGHPFTGFLYAGVMVDDKGNSKVLEYNVRFGDPETQPIMMRLKSSMVDLIEAALDEKLDEAQIEWDQRSSLGVVLAAGGYPDKYNKGDVITGIPEETENSKVFHAGTVDDGELKTNGGRVLCAVGLGDSVSEAQQVAYAVVDKISWDNVYVRRDIGHRAVSREQKLS